jgi:hypothetical protein
MPAPAIALAVAIVCQDRHPCSGIPPSPWPDPRLYRSVDDRDAGARYGWAVTEGSTFGGGGSGVALGLSAQYPWSRNRQPGCRAMKPSDTVVSMPSGSRASEELHGTITVPDESALSWACTSAGSWSTGEDDAAGGVEVGDALGVAAAAIPTVPDPFVLEAPADVWISAAVRMAARTINSKSGLTC